MSKQNLIKRVVRWWLIVMGISLAAWNLAELIPTNPEYEASWWKFAGGIFFAIYGGNYFSPSNPPAQLSS